MIEKLIIGIYNNFPVKWLHYHELKSITTGAYCYKVQVKSAPDFLFLISLVYRKQTALWYIYMCMYDPPTFHDQSVTVKGFQLPNITGRISIGIARCCEHSILRPVCWSSLIIEIKNTHENGNKHIIFKNCLLPLNDTSSWNFLVNPIWKHYWNKILGKNASSLCYDWKLSNC